LWKVNTTIFQQAFYMVGTIEQAVEKAKKMAAS
jgi:F0F1-type ATP synthase beta subunit